MLLSRYLKYQDEAVEKYAPSMNVIDKLMGRLDEMIMLKLITEWRDSVWDHTQKLLLIPHEDDRAKNIRDLEKKVLK